MIGPYIILGCCSTSNKAFFILQLTSTVFVPKEARAPLLKLFDLRSIHANLGNAFCYMRSCTCTQQMLFVFAYDDTYTYYVYKYLHWYMYMLLYVYLQVEYLHIGPQATPRTN